LAEKLRLNIEENPLAWQGSTIPVTVSIGLASSTAEQALDFERLYRGADTALYQAKDRGRNRVAAQVVEAVESNPRPAAN
jgi:diguanylate cyclase (GGDEF)-like protein